MAQDCDCDRDLDLGLGLELGPETATATAMETGTGTGAEQSRELWPRSAFCEPLYLSDTGAVAQLVGSIASWLSVYTISLYRIVHTTILLSDF